ncbi:hypothetical protein ACEWY4_026631 [Coilia grayii]|uniref:Rho termination factor N-terminal domain-containing protein n=1 Tax=Coilia grayii TaxID=363190 RepID=A0ABD1IQM9_9TELE
MKKRVHKYKLDKLKRELEALGVDIHENGKKTKRELRKLLVRELKKNKYEIDEEPTEENGMGKSEGIVFPMEIPDDIADVLKDLDAVLNKEMEELERNEQKEDEVKAMLDNLQTTVKFALGSASSQPRANADEITGVVEKVQEKANNEALGGAKAIDLDDVVLKDFE